MGRSPERMGSGSPETGADPGAAAVALEDRAALVAGLPVFPLAGLDVGNRKGVHGGALRVFAPPVIEAGCVGAGVAHEIGGDGEIVPAGKQLLPKIVARRWPGPPRPTGRGRERFRVSHGWAHRKMVIIHPRHEKPERFAMRLNCTPCPLREGPAPAGSCVFFSGQGRGRGQAPAQPRVTPVRLTL